MADYRIEGQLVLDNNEFDKALQNATERLNQFVSSFNDIKSLNNNLNNVIKDISKLQQKINGLEETVNKSISSSESKLKNSSEKIKKEIKTIQTTLDGVLSKVNKTNEFSSAIKGVNEYTAKMKEATASAIEFFQTRNQKIGMGFAGTNEFSSAIKGANEYIVALERVDKQLRLTQKYQYNSKGNVASVGFAGSSQFQNMNKSLSEYNKLSRITNINTRGMGSSFERLGNYTKSASSKVSTFGGVLRSLRTSLSLIGGMFIWDFALKLGDATTVTIKSKNEMESYFETLGWGNTQINKFNSSLDKTMSKFQKMNRYQLGEAVASLGIEFNMTQKQMEKVANVAPMIINEYLRAGRSTEEAILAIKDVSQGEFQRLSRETGISGKDLQEKYDWNGDDTDIESLYTALEKAGKERGWDVFASKANSLNDVLLITENRITEFAAVLNEYATKAIVWGFNNVSSAISGVISWFNNLSVLDQSYIKIGSLITGLAGVGTVIVTKVGPALKSWEQNLLANSLKIDTTILKEEGLSRAIAHETIAEKVANTQRKSGNMILDAKIRTLKSEELANKLGMSTSKLRSRYLALESQAFKVTGDSTKSKMLAQKALSLSEKEGLTTTQAMTLVLEEERLANMNSVKALIVRKLNLDSQIAEESGLAAAIVVKTGIVEADTVATWGAVAATGALLALLAPFVIALGAVVVVLGNWYASQVKLTNEIKDYNDTLENGNDKVKELEKKHNDYKNTLDEVEAKYKNGTATKKEYNKALEDEQESLDTLHYYQHKLKRAQEMQEESTKANEFIERKRVKALKELNKQLDELYGKKPPKTGSSNESDDDEYFGSWEREKKRIEEVQQYHAGMMPQRQKAYLEMLKAGNETREDAKKYGKEWEVTYQDIEIAMDKMKSDDFLTRVGGYWDNFWAQLKINWMETDAWLTEEFVKLFSWDSLSDAFSQTNIGQMIDELFGIGENDNIKVKLVKYLKPFADLWNDPLGTISSWFGSSQNNATKTFDISGLLSFTKEKVYELGGQLWDTIDEYLTNHVPLYGWLKNLLPSDDAESHGQESGGKVVSGVKTGIEPVDNAINEGLSGVNGLLSQFGITWGDTSKRDGGKIKGGIVDPNKATKDELNRKLTPIDILLNRFGVSWEGKAKTSGGKIKEGVRTGSDGASKPVSKEMSFIDSIIGNTSFFTTAKNAAATIINGIKAGLNQHSPGDAAKAVRQEMLWAAGFIQDESSSLYLEAQNAGQSMVNGFQSMDLSNQLNNAFNSMNANSDNVIGLNRTTLHNTTQTYDNLGNMVNTTFAGIDSDINAAGNDVSNSLNQMNVNVKSNFDSMSSNTESNMKNTASINQSYLNSMSSSTLSTTKHMTSAWKTMSTHIVSSANYIRSQSYSKFNSLHKSISSFYNQLASAKFSAGSLVMGGSELGRGRRLRIGRLGHNTGGRIRMSRHVSKPKLSDNAYGTSKSFKEAHVSRIMNTAYPWEIGDPWFLGIRIPMNNHVGDFKNGGSSVRVNPANFETILRDILTARGFANPNTYEYYANSKRSNQQVWDQVRCNCYDGAEMIVEIGQMLGLSGHLVHGSWKGEGHMGAMVGGKLYDMTQFQKRGVFRGTSGVSFGTRGNGGSHGTNAREETKKIININVTNDLSNARIYGIDDLDNHIKRTTEETFYELNSPDGALGY